MCIELMSVPFHRAKHGGGTTAVTQPMSLFVIEREVRQRCCLCILGIVPDRSERGRRSIADAADFILVYGVPDSGIVMQRWGSPLQRSGVRARGPGECRTAGFVMRPLVFSVPNYG